MAQAGKNGGARKKEEQEHRSAAPAGPGGAPNPMADEEGQEGWAPMKLVAAGAVTLLCALTVIIWMGSRFEGCVYVDGARPGHAIGR